MPQLVLSSSPATLLFRTQGTFLKSHIAHPACPAKAFFRSPARSPSIGRSVKSAPVPALLGGSNFLTRIAPLRVYQESPPSASQPFTARSTRKISMAAVPEKMKAWQYAQYGGGAGSLELVDKTVPKPGPDEILLKIHASSVNPVDWKIQSGALKAVIWIKLPMVPGTDFAGTVAAVGSNIAGFSVGDRILAKVDVYHQGAFAEYAVIDTKTIARLPPGVSFEDAAGLPVGAMTALQGLIKGGLSFPKGTGRVLVQAASGGVGHYAVQLAKYAGAHVTATASTRNIDLVKSLGADEVLDYKKLADPANPFQSASKQPYDVILHCTSKEEPWDHWQKVLAKDGKVVSFTPGASYIARSALQAATFSEQRLIPMILSANSKDLQMLVDLVGDKKLKTVVDSKYPLSEAKKAWERSIDGHSVGKIVVVAE